MIIPLYILGLLQRHGPQHGYYIKKIISNQISDFTRIKLSAIYYHLDKMSKDGLLTSKKGKNVNKPEKIIYSLTKKGKKKFYIMLVDMLDFEYKPEFKHDAAFYFLDNLNQDEVCAHLKQYIIELKASIQVLNKHRKEIEIILPEKIRNKLSFIFGHHEHHYKAELNWAWETFNNLKSKN